MFNIRHTATPSGDAAGMSRIGTSRQRALKSKSALVARNNNVDEGVIAFGLWLNEGESRNSSTIPLTLKVFHQDKMILLHDNILGKEVIVRIANGVPVCNECKTDDCMHVGFAVCAEQMKRRSRLE